MSDFISGLHSTSGVHEHVQQHRVGRTPDHSRRGAHRARPGRLPGAVSWTLRAVRQVRDYATGATSQLRTSSAPDFEDLRKPLAQLNELRG